METLPIFNLQYPTKIDGVDSNILNPANSWKNKDEFKESFHKVAEMFNENFKKYETIASSTVKAGAPKLWSVDPFCLFSLESSEKQLKFHPKQFYP